MEVHARPPMRPLLQMYSGVAAITSRMPISRRAGNS